MYKDKKRDMLRSLLPSTRRHSARTDKRNAHRVERTKVRTALYPIYDLESAEDCETDLFYSCDHLMRGIVRDRRNADKTKPFERWIVAKTAHLDDPHDKWNYAKKLLPANLIGDHALTHLPYDWDPDVCLYGYRPYRYHRKTRQEWEHEYLALYEALYEVCTSYRKHARLNDRLKDHFDRSIVTGYDAARMERLYGRCACGRCDEVRTLGGTGDIEDFIKDWHRRPKGVQWTWRRRLIDHGDSWAMMMRYLREEGLL